jgi:hypothetical protein
MAPGGHHDLPGDVAIPLSYSQGVAAYLLGSVAAAPLAYGWELLPTCIERMPLERHAVMMACVVPARAPHTGRSGVYSARGSGVT